MGRKWGTKMAKTIVLTSPEQRELFGLDETVSGRSQEVRKHQERVRWGRQDAKQRIVQACSYRELSRLEIAKTLGLTKSPHFRTLIQEMVEERLLVEETGVMPNGVIIYKYIAR